MMRQRLWVCIGFLLSCAVGSTGCTWRDPILLGYAAQLTGPQSDLGVDTRDGVILAIDELNDAGGVAGRRLELLIRDDKGDPATARQVDAELVQLGVVAIMGHTTSGQVAAVFDQMNQARVVLFSPTASSDQFSARDDYFFRIVPTNSLQAHRFAQTIRASGINAITGVYDLNNRAYAETYWRNFAAEFRSLNGVVSGEIAFTSGKDDLNAVAVALAATSPQAIIIVASAFDTALLAQTVRQAGVAAPLFASAWAQTAELAAKGGQAVAGMQIMAIYWPECPQPAFQAFVKRFEARYHRQPSFGAVYGYDSVMTLARGLARSGNSRESLRTELSRLGEVVGLQNTFVLDSFGDVRRDLYLAVVRNGQFETTSIVPPRS